MATIYVENKPYEVDPKQNLLHACLSLGFDVPYFCWHPALGSVGACRQCAVKQFKDEADTRGKLVMACMTAASAGSRISIADSEADEFRRAVIQGLMQNHPHDCPVCDEGGECHLQDMTVMTGHRGRRYNFTKRTFRNQYLGPFLNHEMNRCIQCQRCVRYYRDYAGGHDLNAFRLRDQVFFGRAEDGVLENEFSGNLVEICPTGVFTDATLKKHYTRKWDLQMAPSVCGHCGLGCNISVGERYGSVRRVVNRYNAEVNGYFLCDRGRFGYEFVNSPDRVEEPRVAGKTVAKEDALRRVAELVGGGNVMGIGSPRASLESNFALRELVGAENFFNGIVEAESAAVEAILRVLRKGPVPSASLHEVEVADAAFVIGEDLTNVAPIMALRLRQSVRQAPMRRVEKMGIPLWLDQAAREAVQSDKGPLFLATPYETRLEDIATEAMHAAPDDIARLAFAVAHEIDGDAPGVEDLRDSRRVLASAIAQALLTAERPLVISGCSLGSIAAIEGAAQIAWALKKRGRDTVRLAFTTPEANSFGVGMFAAGSLDRALQEARQGNFRAAIVLENDLFRRAASSAATQFLADVEHVIVVDHMVTETVRQADVVLPGGTFAETDGTLVNSEGRAQRFLQVFPPAGNVQESWRWIRDTAASSGQKDRCGWASLDDVIGAMARALPSFARVREAAPSREAAGKIAREPNRYSGRTSMLANITVHEPKPQDDPDSALAFSMESGLKQPPPALTPFFWAPGWNSIQATAKFQSEVGGALRGGDPGARLIEPNTRDRVFYSFHIPHHFRERTQDRLVVPMFHIFGSEELSVGAKAIAELAPHPYLALHPLDAAVLGVASGDTVKLNSNGETLALPVKIDAGLPQGVAGAPAGVGPLVAFHSPIWASFSEATASVAAARGDS
ncbi:MAG TPA: NADH-quinone oxidoreductase subunit NuoG [Bryobacteraceae bacterium]|nr:NADH-quinone oxidoreductase subunit NuoG [Bryobacteraceae bacterium]